PLGAEGDPHGVSQLVHPRFELATSLLVVCDLLCHRCVSSTEIAGGGQSWPIGTLLCRVPIQPPRSARRNPGEDVFDGEPERPHGPAAQRFERRAHGRRGRPPGPQPPATAGMIETVSPSGTLVSSPSRKRTSSSATNTLTKRRSWPS